MRGLARAALVLGVVALVTFGAQARRLGFYLDDWVMLERLLDAPGWWAGVKSLAQTNYAFRTLSLVVFPTLFKLFGTAPFGWQATLIALDWALAWLFYVWIRGWTESERLALTAAALAIMLPICPASHHWITNVSQKLALPLCVGALELHRRWLADRRPRLLGWALGAYAASLLLYESATFFPAVQAAAYYVSLPRKGKPARATARDVLLPFGLALAAATAWRLLYPVVFGQGFPVSPGFRPGPFFRDYLLALDSWGPEVLAVSWKVTAAWRELLGDGEKIFAGLFTVGLAWRLSRPWTDRPDRRRLALASVIAAAGFFSAYLPFALSGAYEPQVVGIMSRVNAAGALFEALALACLLEGVLHLPTAGRFARGALLAGLIGPFTCTNWFIAKTWSEAYAIEEKILSGIAAWLAKLPTTHVIVLQDAPSNLSGAEVFSAHWGFDAALRIRSGRKDVRGIVVLPTMRTEPRGLVDYAFDPPHVTPYDGMLLYHYPSSQMRRPVPSK